jgi:hypothetical protein
MSLATGLIVDTWALLNAGMNCPHPQPLSLGRGALEN